MAKTLVSSFTALLATACLAPTEHTGPENDLVAMDVTSIDTSVGAVAMEGAIQDIAWELSSPHVLESTADLAGQSVEERHAFLVSLLQDIDSDVQQSRDDYARRHSCIRHSDVNYRTRYTGVRLDRGIFYATSFTAATRTTDITHGEGEN